jgi:hypothetical protein
MQLNPSSRLPSAQGLLLIRLLLSCRQQLQHQQQGLIPQQHRQGLLLQQEQELVSQH